MRFFIARFPVHKLPPTDPGLNMFENLCGKLEILLENIGSKIVVFEKMCLQPLLYIAGNPINFHGIFQSRVTCFPCLFLREISAMSDLEIATWLKLPAFWI